MEDGSSTTIRSEFGEMTVYETNHLGGENGRFRGLRFSDGDVQGAMDLRDRGRIVLGYQRALVALMDARPDKPEKIFVVGHGIGTIAGSYPDREVRVAEIDPAVLELSRTYFGYDRDNVRIGDGRALLADEPDRYWDCVVLDAFTSKGVPERPVSLEFFSMAASKLRSGGAMFANAIGKTGNGGRIGSLCETFGQAFPYVRVYCSTGEKPSESRNFLLAGSDRPLEFGKTRLVGYREIQAPDGHVVRDSRV